MSLKNNNLIPLLLLIAGCQQMPQIPVPSLPGLGPHKIDIQQGNLVTQDMLDKLQSGMTRNQVRFVLGTPLLVDPFRTDRWDYVYIMNKAGERIEQRQLKVFFQDDRMVRYEGDVVAAAKPKPEPANTAAKPGDKPAAEPPGFFGRMFGAKPDQPASTAVPAAPAVAVPVKPATVAPAPIAQPAPAVPAREVAPDTAASPQLRMAPDAGTRATAADLAPALAPAAPQPTEPLVAPPLDAPPLPRLVLPPEPGQAPQQPPVAEIKPVAKPPAQPGLFGRLLGASPAKPVTSPAPVKPVVPAAVTPAPEPQVVEQPVAAKPVVEKPVVAKPEPKPGSQRGFFGRMADTLTTPAKPIVGPGGVHRDAEPGLPPPPFEDPRPAPKR